MRRARALAGGLAVIMFAAPGCGTSTVERIKQRDPPGGDLRSPDVAVENVDELRAVEVAVAANRFQPQQASVGLDSSVRIVNKDRETVYLRQIKPLGHPIEDDELEPGEHVELEFLEGGRGVIGMKGSRARLEINVFAQP